MLSSGPAAVIMTMYGALTRCSCHNLLRKRSPETALLCGLPRILSIAAALVRLPLPVAACGDLMRDAPATLRVKIRGLLRFAAGKVRSRGTTWGFAVINNRRVSHGLRRTQFRSKNHS